MGNGIPIHVLGTSFTIQTDESPEYVRRLVDYVTKKIETLGRSVSTKDSLRLAVLASILIADELFKARSIDASRAADDAAGPESSGRSDIDERIGILANHMIKRLDAALDGPTGGDT